MRTIKKAVLKEKDSYYYEAFPIYDSLPTKLTVPDFTTEIFPRRMSHRDILKEYNITPYETVAEATAVIASIIPDLKNDYNGRLVYFKHDGEVYRWGAFRSDDGQLDVRVRGVDLDDTGGTLGVAIKKAVTL